MSQKWPRKTHYGGFLSDSKGRCPFAEARETPPNGASPTRRDEDARIEASEVEAEVGSGMIIRIAGPSRSARRAFRIAHGRFARLSSCTCPSSLATCIKCSRYSRTSAQSNGNSETTMQRRLPTRSTFCSRRNNPVLPPGAFRISGLAPRSTMMRLKPRTRSSSAFRRLHLALIP